jgi:hypothetical protein
MKHRTSKQIVDIEFVNMWGDSPSYLGAQTAINLGKGFKDESAMRESRDRWSAERMRRTEELYPKEKILEAHSKYKTFNDVINYLGIGWETYLRLCEVYELQLVKWDKTTKNHGPSKPILVYKIIEIPAETYSSKKQLSRNLLGCDTGNAGFKIHSGTIDYSKKIHYTTDINHRKCRFKLTGNKTQIGTTVTYIPPVYVHVIISI